MAYKVAPESLLGKSILSPDFFQFCRELNFKPSFCCFSCDVPESGLAISCRDNGIIEVIYLYSRPYGVFTDVSPYPGCLPPNVQFSLSRKEAAITLGSPVGSGDAEIYKGQQIVPWDKFDFGQYLVVLNYNEKVTAVNQVTLCLK
jgi:hypothetical protein